MARPVRLTLLSRASRLARLQAALVERALRTAHPDLEVVCTTRAAAGDRDSTTALWQMGDKGAFTSDLSDALRNGEADVVVHSWKDLPIASPAGTVVAATLERADPRDVLLVRRTAVTARPARITVLSSSPRRAWLLGRALPDLLPWRVDEVRTEAVRGNIDTRLAKLVEGEADALVMAKAALDRLLSFGEPFDDAAAAVRRRLDDCHWMVLPMREFPWAPAQGAVAIEIADRGRADLETLLASITHAPTWRAVAAERAILAAAGGGCHQALGAAVVERDFGRVVSVRSKEESDAAADERWILEGSENGILPAAPDRLWPRRGETLQSTRRPLGATRPEREAALWVSRADALPDGWADAPDTLVWAAGSRTWRRLAARGVWVHGCADGLGEDEPPPVDTLAGRPVRWVRLTHSGAERPGDLATYTVETTLPDDLPSRTHLFWTSGELFLQALDRWPELRGAWHASGPGRTRDVIRTTLGVSGRTGLWLDRESWERDICL